MYLTSLHWRMDHIMQKTKPLNTEFENIFEQDPENVIQQS